jgi:hypothetical protein
METPEVAYDDHPIYLGKRLRIERRGEVQEGIMAGIAKDAHIAIGPVQSVHPWVLRLDDGTTRLFIPGYWNIPKMGGAIASGKDLQRAG